VTGWVVLGADAEEGGFLSKSSVQKIAVIETPNYKCVIGGSGDGDFIDLAVQDAEQALAAYPDVVTLNVARLTLEEVVTSIYTERIDALPINQQEDAGFQLLCALWTKESATAELVKVGRG